VRADRPSSTATLIAAATVFLARDPRLAQLVPPGAAELCARCLEAASPRRLALAELASRPAWRWAARLAERATIPGLLAHFMLRKRWIEQMARAALADGIGQLVVVGAGFDTLGARLAPEFGRVKFIEVDHPATQLVKLAALGFSEKNFAGNLSFIPADLAATGLESILKNSFEIKNPSLFVIEGLLMYLSDAQIGELFEALGRLQRGGGRVVFTQMAPAPDGRSRFHNATPLVTGLLGLWREPFKSALPRADAALLLKKFSYQLLQTAGAPELRKLLGPETENPPLAEGEMLYLAQR
jgi:methyltransferase (TIGR00027 family)